MKKWIKSIPFIIIAAMIILAGGSVGKVEQVWSMVSYFITDEKPVVLEKDEVLIDRVIDGDTVKVELPSGDVESVRLLLIDTPESVHPNKPVQPYGKEASKFAKQYLHEGQKVILEKGNPERDKYGRLLGYIFVDGKNFNQLMIEKGYARVAYVYEPNTKYLSDFKAAESKAKKNRTNIWSISGYVESEFENY